MKSILSRLIWKLCALYEVFLKKIMCRFVYQKKIQKKVRKDKGKMTTFQTCYWNTNLVEESVFFRTNRLSAVPDADNIRC